MEPAPLDRFEERCVVHERRQLRDHDFGRVLGYVAGHWRASEWHVENQLEWGLVRVYWPGERSSLGVRLFQCGHRILADRIEGARDVRQRPRLGRVLRVRNCEPILPAAHSDRARRSHRDGVHQRRLTVPRNAVINDQPNVCLGRLDDLCPDGLVASAEHRDVTERTLCQPSDDLVPAARHRVARVRRHRRDELPVGEAETKLLAGQLCDLQLALNVLGA